MKTMNRVFKYAFWKLKGTKVYALVGKSGTGKSFRSKLVAQKYRIDLIIDDGLLIRGDRILSGKSAKREENVLSAVRTAVFDDPDHQKQVRETLEKEKYHKVLIIGTSEKMVYKIASRLNLPQPEKLFRIEDIATKEQIETAMRIRYSEGKHVIPVPSIEITRNYPQIVYDSMRVFQKNKRNVPFKRKNVSFEKTIVRPEFSKYGKVTVSEAALTQMVAHCLDEFDSQIKIKRVQVQIKAEGYALTVKLRVPMQHQISTTLGELQEYIADSLEKYGGIFVSSVNIEIEEWG
jgi:adenylate kinase family enzyme